MPLFGKKKEVKQDIQEIKQIVGKSSTVDFTNQNVMPQKFNAPHMSERFNFPQVEKVERKIEKAPEPQPEKVQSAPLFVKIDKYRQILNTMNYLKTTLVMIKSTFSILNELDRLRAENLKIIEDTITKLDNRLVTLDSEFLRPSGFHEEMAELHDVQSIEATLTDLRSQIDSLKGELSSTA